MAWVFCTLKTGDDRHRRPTKRSVFDNYFLRALTRSARGHLTAFARLIDIAPAPAAAPATSLTHDDAYSMNNTTLGDLCWSVSDATSSLLQFRTRTRPTPQVFEEGTLVRAGKSGAYSQDDFLIPVNDIVGSFAPRGLRSLRAHPRGPFRFGRDEVSCDHCNRYLFIILLSPAVCLI